MATDIITPEALVEVEDLMRRSRQLEFWRNKIEQEKERLDARIDLIRSSGHKAVSDIADKLNDENRRNKAP